MEYHPLPKEPNYWQPGLNEDFQRMIQHSINGMRHEYVSMRPNTIYALASSLRLTYSQKPIYPTYIALGVTALTLTTTHVIDLCLTQLPSEPATTYLDHIQNTYRTYAGHAVPKIFIHYIPRKKTILDDELQRHTTGRLKNQEMMLIRNQNHFVRIYTDLCTNPDYTTELPNISIFTDILDQDFIDQICLHLPMIYSVQADKPGITEERKKVLTAYLNIMRFLYKCAYTDHRVHSTNTEIWNALIPLTKTYAELNETTVDDLKEFFKEIVKKQETTRVSHFKEQINMLKSQICSQEETIRNEYIELYNKQNVLNALLNNEEHIDVSEIISLLQKNPAIKITDIENGKLHLRITAPLMYYTSSDFETYEKNSHSNYNQLFPEESYATTKAILHDTFITKKYALIVENDIVITNTASWNSTPLNVRATQDTPVERMTHLPNPHLYYYDCWDAAKHLIGKYACSGEYDLLIMQIIAAVQTVNIAETATFVNRLLKDIKRYPEKVYLKELETNTICTLAELIALRKPNPKPVEKPAYTQIVIEEETPLETINPAEMPETAAIEQHTPADADMWFEIGENDEDNEDIGDNE